MRALSLLVAFLLFVGAAPVRAQEPPTVTLEASSGLVTYPGSVRLSGRVEPVVEAESVRILDQEGRIRAEATPDAEGAYSVSVQPLRSTTFTAQYALATSEEVRVRVRSLVRARLRSAPLFGRAVVTGSVRPRHRGERAEVRLVRNGKVVATKRVRLHEGMWLKTGFRITKIGTYRARVIFNDEDHAPGLSGTDARSTFTPSLTVGSESDAVKRLERRLIELGYYLPGADRSYDTRTRDAVIAFNKVQGLTRSGSVDAATWQALASPRRASARYDWNGRHIEIDQTQQVVKVVDGGRVRWVLHTSTGANGYTHDGLYRFYRQIDGYSGGRLYYPSYFDGRRAIHGWPEVPTYPASHGCARIPMWAAQWMNGLIPLGMRVAVYH
jgi:peptidoglycan hydrolase-like protein with peptidoglycan-binding domain